LARWPRCRDGQGVIRSYQEGELTVPLLTTKLYIPPVRPELVSRPRLIEQLEAGLAVSLPRGERLLTEVPT
jgi:hypothetical protein